MQDEVLCNFGSPSIFATDSSGLVFTCMLTVLIQLHMHTVSYTCTDMYVFSTASI